MKQLLALLLFAPSLCLAQSVTLPYNPDVNADSAITSTDLLGLLPIFGGFFTPEEVLIDGMTINEYLLLMEENGGALPVEGSEHGQMLYWNGDGWVLVSVGENGQFLGLIDNTPVWQDLPTGAGVPEVGCADQTACNYDSGASVNWAPLCVYEDECGVCDGPGTIYECGCADLPEGGCDCDGNQLDALNVCGGICAADVDGDGICDDGDDCIGEADECGVCNGPGAIYECGCTGIAPDECDCAGTPDEDQDGICDTEDPCIGIADSDGDGICDDVDDCDGTLDLCGICNGPGPIYACGCSDIPEGDCDCAGNEPDMFGNCEPYAADTDDDGILDSLISNSCINNNEISYWNSTYDLVSIGTQCWFKSSLLSTQFRDGTELTNATSPEDWLSGNNPKYIPITLTPGNDSVTALLYNGWAASHSSQGTIEIEAESLCPQYFRVAKVEDWNTLIEFLSDSAGSKLKSAGTNFWSNPNNATNSSGFSALPFGQISPITGTHESGNTFSFFWADGNTTSSLNPSFFMSHSGTNVETANHSNLRGHQVRCIRQESKLGCTDPNFSEYDSEANVDDGSCSIPSIFGCTNPNYYEFNATANSDDGSCENLLGCSQFDDVQFNDYSYPVVTIGEQCWFQINLRSTQYQDGSLISRVQDSEEWNNLTSGAYDFPDSMYLTQIGLYYNKYAVLDTRELCPTGWHVPSESDFLNLFDYLGSGTAASDALRASANDSIPWNGTNSSGFAALPGGEKRTAPAFCGFGWANALFWTKSGGTGSCYTKYAGLSSNAQIGVANHYATTGMNVRCIKD